ncbi:glycosyltransferase family 4 protein [Desulfosediminicola ganghwensis]|uniref:glycosyltransferase family 4 protein n=1 Tax=Desulfosediminicola ganghwensis TaxID=2569540 RepID=UPI0010ACCF85|nr:glycosyltransferase family 4 protein [Desulfosediminicola ganghwensis]
MNYTTSKIAYILKGYPRISETFISNEILQLEQHGFSLRIFSMRHPRENFSHDSVKKIKARVDYLPTELLLDFPRLITPNIFLAAQCPSAYRAALKLARRRFNRTRKLATLKHMLQAGYMTWHFLRTDSTIHHLHGHFAHSPTSVTMFAAILANKPFSFTAHAKDIYTSNPNQLAEKIEAADFVVTCTQANEKYLQSISGGCNTPIHCIYHGIDLALFNNIKQPHPVREPYKFFTIARLTEKKGLPTLYQALAILKQQGVAFNHVLIGDGDDREKILDLICTLNLTDSCSWLGTRTHDDVLTQFSQTDLFILPCEIAENGDRDGIPNVLVESLAMGVPAISTNVSAIPEIIIDGQTGRTVEPRNPDQLARAILEIMEDESLRNTFISNGKEWVNERFDNTRWLLKLAEIFENQPHLRMIN